MKSFNYYFITNIPSIASYVELHGVNRIFVDLEINGKEERQAHVNSVISRHSMLDVKKIKQVLKHAHLVVRLNPLYSGSKNEIDEAISAGADFIMQPMIKDVADVVEFGRLINGRVKLIPLIETISSATQIKQIHDLPCVDEIHIGLNDLHLEYKLGFMFELIANGLVDKMTNCMSKSFGIGGIARVGHGNVPGEIVMAEHIRLGSSAVILSRAFHNGANNLCELNMALDFALELEKLEKERYRLSNLSSDELLQLHFNFVEAVKLVVIGQ